MTHYALASPQAGATQRSIRPIPTEEGWMSGDLITHEIHGTVPEDEWVAFFKRHFKLSPGGGKEPVKARIKTKGSCEDYGCPTKHPTSGSPLTGCTVEIAGGKVVTVSCHYRLAAR